jgi:hypothetical protein
MKTLKTSNLIQHDDEAGMNYITYGCKVEKELGKVVYEFENGCKELVYGIYDLQIKYGKDGNRYLVLSGKYSDFEFLFPENTELEFSDLNENSKAIGVNCQIADNYSISISGAMLKDYENTYHNL